ncbi:family 16 glycosylhydrolase [Kutzneria sp. NPDC052558]|uniref:glycoside hydrolase family 16 protein n=1 Tax=Kutzneria sp. NPDC052558 TaxID=3364121 RepID=UPI0037C8182F
MIRLLVALMLLGSTLPPASGWQLVARDDFDGPLPAHWSAYDGDPTCCAATFWRPGQVTTEGGDLKVTSSRQADGSWLSGGLSAAGWPDAVRTYGRYEARIRLDRGTGVSGVALLWPVADHWPPEIDYFEVWGKDPGRGTDTMTTHRAGDNVQQADVYHGDLSGWHTIAVDWLPTSIQYEMDGAVVGTVTDRSLIPTEPMWPAFQTHVELCRDVCPNASTPSSVSLWVDWIAIYRPIGSPSTSTTTPPPTTTTPPQTTTGPPTTTPSTSVPTSPPPVVAAPPPSPDWVPPFLGLIAASAAGGLLVLWLRRRRL